MSAKKYQPPFTLTSEILTLATQIGEEVGRLSILLGQESELRLRRINRIRSVTGSLAIEGNTLSEAQITAILDGKRVIAPPREIQEAHNALAAYEQLEAWKPQDEESLLSAHQVIMKGLLENTGRYRHGGVGVMAGDKVLHMAPPASRVPRLMAALFAWLAGCKEHPLIASSVFHYEFEFIHPFTDGNGRMGRLWQTLILSQWQPVFAHLPVESLVHKHQAKYYQALNESTQKTDCAPFILFMLRTIREAMREADSSQIAPQVTPHVTPHVTPQIAALLRVMSGEMSRDELQAVLELKDRKSFQQRYLQVALAQGLIEMTVPDKPRSRLQKYRLTELGAAWTRGNVE